MSEKRFKIFQLRAEIELLEKLREKVLDSMSEVYDGDGEPVRGSSFESGARTAFNRVLDEIDKLTVEKRIELRNQKERSTQ